MKVLVAGATGFVGSRLVKALADAGHEVQALTRRPEEYDGPGTAVGGDVEDADSLGAALTGCEAAYYLVHSLDSPDFANGMRRCAHVRAIGASRAGEADHHLGGLGDEDASGEGLSPHLRSRQEVETLLGEAGVPVTSIRAGIIIGHGGLSWELMRQLVAHLPVMVTPRWVRTKAQPARSATSFAT